MYFFKNPFLQTVFVIALLILGSYSWLSLNLLPDPLALDAPTGAFSASRAHEHVKRLSRVPRRLGSSAHEATRDYILKEVSSLGCELSLQKTFSSTAFRSGVFAGPVENILCFFKGTKTDSIMLMSHYDSVHMSPGAGDAASGVAIILETARSLATVPRENGLLLLFTDGEETGLLGAAAFVKSQLHKKYNVRTLLNFEARGNSGPLALFETLKFNSHTSKAIQQMPRPIGNSFMDFLYQFLPNETDVSIFKSHDIPALNFAFARGLEHYHKSSDTPENLSMESLQHAGDSALHSTRFLLNNSLTSSNSKRLYQDIFGRHHVSYPPQLIKILSVFLLLIILTTLLARRPSFLKTFLGIVISSTFLVCVLFITHYSHILITRLWGPSSVIIDFYLFFLAFALVLLAALHLGFLKIKSKLPEIHFGLLINLGALLVLSFYSEELGTLIVWSSAGVVIYCLRSTLFWRVVAIVPMAIFLPQFIHSALVADSGTQFVLPAFVLSFACLLLHLLLTNPHLTKTFKYISIKIPDKGLSSFMHFVAIGLGLGLFSFLGYKHHLGEALQKRADFFEILFEDRLYVALSKSQKVETIFPQKADAFKTELLLSALTRWKINPSFFDVYETFSELKRDIKSSFTKIEKNSEPTQYLLNVAAQDYECVHLLFDPEEPIFDIKINDQSPYPVPSKKFSTQGPTSPNFVETCSLRKVPLKLEFKTAAGQRPLRELLAVFTQNTEAPRELKINPRDTIMSHFSNTLYVLKKIAL